MSANLAARQQSRHSIAWRKRMGALCAAWATCTLTRAIADVASISDRDYRDFGLDKVEILRGLRQLRDDIEFSNLRVSTRWPLAIALVKAASASTARAASFGTRQCGAKRVSAGASDQFSIIRR
jgi:hypothetical protein